MDAIQTIKILIMLEIIILTSLCVICVPPFIYDMVTGNLSKDDTPKSRKFKSVVFYLFVITILVFKTIESYQKYYAAS
jgi:hypothetical protein